MRDPNDFWPKVLTLAVHELRTPAGVVSGYGRMLLQDRAGAIEPAQRKLLEAADRSSVRVAELLAQMSELVHIEDGTAPVTLEETDLAALVPPLEPATPLPTVRLRADPTRLGRALSALARLPASGNAALAAEVREDRLWLAIGAREEVGRAGVPAADALTTFDHLRGGRGLDLVLAHVVIEAHGGQIAALAGTPPGREVVVVQLPIAGTRP